MIHESIADRLSHAGHLFVVLMVWIPPFINKFLLNNKGCQIKPHGRTPEAGVLFSSVLKFYGELLIVIN